MKKEHFLHERKKKHFLMCDAEWCFFLLPKTLFRGNISSVLREKVILFSQFHTWKTFLSDLNNQTLVWCLWFSPIIKINYTFLCSVKQNYILYQIFFSLCTHFKERFFFFIRRKGFFGGLKLWLFPGDSFCMFFFLHSVSFYINFSIKRRKWITKKTPSVSPQGFCMCLIY